MSRFVKVFGTVEYAYGFDVPLQEYFFDKCDSKLATDDNEDGYIFQVASHFSLRPHPRTPRKHDYANSEIMEIVKEEENKIGEKIWAEEHWEAIGSDLPF